MTYFTIQLNFTYMQTRLFYLWFVVFPLLSHSQAIVNKDFKVTKGTPYEVIDADDKFYFNKGDDILTVKIDGRLITIQKLNAKNLVFLKKTEYKDFPSGFQVESVMKFANKFFLFYSWWQKPREQLYCREIDIATGEFIGQGKLIIKTDRKLTGMDDLVGIVWNPVSYSSSIMNPGIKNPGIGILMNFEVKDKFSFNKSFDQSKLIIQYRLKPEKKDDDVSYDIIGMNVFDPAIKLLWSKELTMPYTEKKMDNLDYSIDGQGNGYILATVYDDNTTKIEKNKKPNYHIELIKIKAVTGEFRITPVTLIDKQITTIWIYEDSKADMLCAGYYCKTKKDINDADGIFLFKVDQEGKVYDEVSHEIPVSVLNQYASERQQKKNEKRDENDKADFEDLGLSELRLANDGSLILIGEQHFTVTKTYYTTSSTGMPRSHSTTTNHYNDMLITKIGPTGNLEWMQKLGKRQSKTQATSNIYDPKRGGMSYQYMFQNGNHYLLFLDNKKNLELPLNKIPTGHVDGMGGFLTAYKVNDASGSVSKMSILNMRDVQGTEVYQFMIDRIIPLSNNEFVVEMYKKKKEDILIKVTLDK